MTLVSAPNETLYLNWLALTGRMAAEYPMITDLAELRGWFGEIIVLNGGSHDPHFQHLIRHPSRSTKVIRIEV